MDFQQHCNGLSQRVAIKLAEKLERDASMLIFWKDSTEDSSHVAIVMYCKVQTLRSIYRSEGPLSIYKKVSSNSPFLLS